MNELIGLSRLGKNIVVSWAAYLCVLVVGFLVPRQISDALGPASLGVWDLGWATVRYLSIGNLGIGGSVSRYVALHRAAGDNKSLAESMTAISVIQIAIAMITILLSVIGAKLIVGWIDLPSQAEQHDAFWVLFLLGASVAIRMFGNPSGGVLTGCHRSDLQHAINAATDVVLAVAMVSVIFFDGGLVGLAITVAVTSALVTVFRIYVALRVCPDAVIRPGHWRLSRGLELMRFGAKSMIGSAPDILVFQTVIIFLAAATGPAAVAVLARGMALIRHCEQLVRRTATMFVPITSSLVGLERKDEAADLVFKIGGYGLAITLPLMLLLVCYGDIVLRVWMGEGYDNQTMIFVLVAGSILPVSQLGTMSVLAGLDAHGRVAIAGLVVSAMVLFIGVLVLNVYGWSVVSAAMLIGCSWTFGRGLVIPAFLKFRFGIELGKYFATSLMRPIALNAPLMILLFLSRREFDDERFATSIVYVLIGATFTLYIYVKVLLPESAKAILAKKVKSSPLGYFFR